jgi:creatinine amidohydrolase
MKHLLSEMTWYEVRERLEKRPVVLLPFGSLEEQGPHAPMGDYMITERIAAEAARRADAIATPTIPFGYSDYFRPFPGAMCLRPETFCLLLEDMCHSFLDHGVQHLVILNGHSGNYPLIDQVTRKVKQERHVRIPCVNLWRIAPADRLKAIYAGRQAEAMGHGADPLTSVYLHLFPELMRLDLIDHKARQQVLGLPVATFNAVKFNEVDVNLPIDADEIRENGIVSGNPELASAQIGRDIFEWIVEFTADFVRYFRTTSPIVASPAPSSPEGSAA